MWIIEPWVLNAWPVVRFKNKVYVLDMYIEGKVETSKTGYPSICFVTTRERVARFHDGYKRPADYFYAHNRTLQSSSSDVLLNHLRNEIGSLYIY